MSRTFLLAPMDGLIRVLTWIILLAGVGLVATSPWLRVGWVPGGLMLGLSAAVYLLWRPTAFDVGGRALRLRYPARTKSIELAGLKSVGRIESAAFRQRFGLALRVGVGGLFGGFGWLWTSTGWVEMDISRTSDHVLLEWSDRVPLLVSPVDADDFVAAVKAEAGLA